MHPRWDQYFGSGGRAAAALTALGIPVTLHSYADDHARAAFETRAALDPTLSLNLSRIEKSPSFWYVHGLSVPAIKSKPADAPIQCDAVNVLRFGMIEGDAIVRAHRVVYDPQTAQTPKGFGENGSKADELALVLNRHEARSLLAMSSDDTEKLARDLAESSGALIIVIKCGPEGILVYDDGVITEIPAYATQHVWKIGSGDQFTAWFAAGWMYGGLSAHRATQRASVATAYFCEHRGSFPTDALLKGFNPAPVPIGERWRQAERPMVYLAGPFFNLAQLWLVEQARLALLNMNLDVFSPYHDVGHGSAEDVVELDLEAIRNCDVLLALADGLDAGSIYEIGYARALGKPVVVYSESESDEDRKMMQGSGCILTDDFVSAVYRTVWIAASE